MYYIVIIILQNVNLYYDKILFEILEGKLVFDNLLKNEYLQSYQTHVQALAKMVENTRFYSII